MIIKISKSPWKLINFPTLVWMSSLSIMVFLFTIIDIKPRLENFIITKEINLDLSKGFIINTKGCKIPELPITNQELNEKYFQYKYDGAHCNKDIPPLVDSNISSLFILESSYPDYNINNTKLMNCCYEELKRKIPNGESDKQYEYGNECFTFNDSIRVKEEFVHVKCKYNNTQIYEDFFAFVPKKSNFSDDDKFNVLVIGIDSVSRLNFHRQMPNTVEYLKEHDFFEFNGYNKIADNTYPNLIVVLSGLNENDTMKTCRNSSRYYDNCTFIWKNFKEKNYVTSFSEDSAWMGTFNYQKYGFQIQPTDYMWGFFDRISEDILGNSKIWNVIQCIGAREVYKMIVTYIKDFVNNMTTWKTPYFAFFWSSSLSHDFLNKPRIGDQLYYDLIKNMNDNGQFEQTIVIVMSDHGMRFGDFRQTYQGRIEERLPSLFIKLPSTFKDKYPLATSNLAINTKKLTTPYDLYETLYDLTILENLKDNFIEKNERKSKSKFGLSLFNKITNSRTCEDAGISAHWCTCFGSTPVNNKSEIKPLMNHTVNYLNNLLKGYAQCETLKLKTIIGAQILTHSEETFGSNIYTKDYLINFITEPGDGSFEATVRKYKNETMDIIGTVSRLNLYGKQSACMTDFHLKLYCYCRRTIW